MSPRASRIATWIVAVMFTAGLVGYLANDARMRDYHQCVEANKGRVVIREFIVAVIDQDGHRSDGELETIVLMNRYLGPRACEAIR